LDIAIALHFVSFLIYAKCSLDLAVSGSPPTSLSSFDYLQAHACLLGEFFLAHIVRQGRSASPFYR
jgi:hypothetical protein